MATCPTCRAQYPDGTNTCEKDGDALLPDTAFAGLDRELTAGFVVGEYRVEEKIGEGGFGSVYRAVHPLIGKAAAIKVLSRQYSANPQVVARFIAEARAVNQIRHRNIIDIFSFGALDDGRQYFVMELLDGMPLDRYLKDEKGRLTVEEALPILRAVGRALDAAHASGILHRDLKPENIFLSFDEDGRPFPKLLDFGIAKLMGGGKGSDPKTRTGTPMGTPYYMSPEQCRGKDVDHRTDIYSFGVLTHELLTGDVPFRGDDVVELLMMQTRVAPPPMSSMCAAVPSALDEPVLRMLAKDPAARPASVGAAVEALVAAAKEAGIGGASFTSGAGASGVMAAALHAAEGASVQRITPAQTTLGSAETLEEGRSATSAKHPGSQTIGAASTDVPIVSKRRSAGRIAMMVFAGSSALMMIGIALVATGVIGGIKREPHVQAPSEMASALPRGGPDVTSVAQQAPAAEQGAATEESRADVDAKAVSVTVRSNPARATVWKDGVKMGETPGPISLPRSADATKLTVRSDGYKSSDVTVDTSKDTTLLVTLTRIERSVRSAPAKAASSAKSDIPTDINEK